MRTGDGTPIPLGQLTDEGGEPVLTNIFGGDYNAAWNISDPSGTTEVGISHNPDWYVSFPSTVPSYRSYPQCSRSCTASVQQDYHLGRPRR